MNELWNVFLVLFETKPRGMFYLVQAINKRKQIKTTRVKGYTKSWCLSLTSNCSLGIQDFMQRLANTGFTGKENFKCCFTILDQMR